MGTEVLNPINSIVNGFLGYLPSLLAGIGLLALGLICGWVVKRIILQLAAILRLDRLLSRSRWKEQFKRADIRYGLFALAGNIGFVLILLVFVDNAFIAWKLTVLSDLLGAGIQFLPRLIIAAAIFWAGWFISSIAQRSISRALAGERIPRASLAARFTRVVLLILFSAMAMVELQFAREVVIIGFTVIIVTLGAIAVASVLILGRDAFSDRGGSDEEGER